MKPNGDKKEVNPNDYKVVKVTNLSKFDFTPAMGAAFDGRPIPLAAGESKVLPYTVGIKLARNLAMQMLLRGTEGKTDDAHKNPNGSVLWTDDQLKALTNKLITDVYQERVEAPKSHTDVLMAKIEDLNKNEDAGANGMTKQDVVKKLESLKIPFNVRDSKADLMVLLETAQKETAGAGRVTSLPAGLLDIGDAPEIPGAARDMTIEEIMNPPKPAY